MTKNKPQKQLLRPLKRKAGRNRSGRITMRHRGGGAKKHYRVVEFGQANVGETLEVLGIEYDPNRTCDIALVKDSKGLKKYILSPHGLKKGDRIEVAEKAELKIGNRMKLKNIVVGTMVYNIELQPGKGGQLARGAGASAQIMAHEGKYTNLKMPSTEIRKILSECFASIGQLSNPEHRFEKMSKAGAARRKGIRPRVRGSAMNPVDHPHGGGEGRTGIGMKYPKTPWGKHALGVKTRNKKKQSSRLIIQRRNKKK